MRRLRERNQKRTVTSAAKSFENSRLNLRRETKSSEERRKTALQIDIVIGPEKAISAEGKKNRSFHRLG